MRQVKFGHKFHPGHPFINGDDVVLAVDFDRVLAERDALLRDTKAMLASELSYELFAKMASHIKRIDAALSASAEPSEECAHSYANKLGCSECGESFGGAEPSAPKCKYCGDTGQFMVGSSGDASDGNAPIMARCEDCELGQASAPTERDERADFESHYHGKIMDNRTGSRFLRSRSGGYLDTEVREMWPGWQARAALEREP